jgi:hypothetical protein
MSITVTSSVWTGYNSITVSWNAYPGATDYTVTVYDYSNPPYSELISVQQDAGNNTTYTITDNTYISYNTPYIIVITASNGVDLATSPYTLPFPPSVPAPYYIAPYSGLGVPCFPQGSRIAVGPTSFKPVEDLKTGDLVLTADGRQVPATIYSRTIESTTTSTAPYLIPKNSLGPQRPLADLRLSPLHAFQLKKGLWHIPMYAAKQSSQIKQYGIGSPVTYYHIECPNFFTDNLIMEGNCVVESFGANQTRGIKTLYKYNSQLKGFTRAAKPSVKALA